MDSSKVPNFAPDVNQNDQIDSVSDYRIPILESKERFQVLLKRLSEDYPDQGDSSSSIVAVDASKLNQVKTVISHEATKLSVGFSKMPYPDKNSTTLMTTKLESAVLSLVTLYCSIPYSAGKVLKSLFKKRVIDVLENIDSFVSVLIADDKQEKLKSIGCVWEYCNNLIDSVPLNNIQAVNSLILKEKVLVDDALTEIQEFAIEEFDEEDDAGQLNQESVIKCMGLIKASKACLKKIIIVLKRCNVNISADVIIETDKMNDLTKDVSSLVDDTIASLYPPIRKGFILQNSHNLAHCLLDIIDPSAFPNLFCSNDISWIKFLKDAIEHNLSIIAEYCGN